MKFQNLIIVFLLLFSTYAQAEGQKDVNNWNVRWSDTNEYGSTYARIRKSEWVKDRGDMNTITMAIEQDIDDRVDISAAFIKDYASHPCSSSEKNKVVTGKVNAQELRMELSIWSEENNCDIHYTWKPLSNEGKAFLRAAFNSGVVRFSHGSFDHIFDTRKSLPAYKLMKKMVAKEKNASENAL